jgi:DNA-binding PadR family transcriptional regulator
MFFSHKHDCGGRRFHRGKFGFGRYFGEHRGRGDFGEGRGRHGGRPGRFFEQGDLRYLLLHLIKEKPSHGYELIKAIEEQLGGAYSPSPGVIYPTLTLLEELGYIAAESSGTKKLFTVTEEGRAFLKENQGIVDTLVKRMADANQIFGDGPPAEFIRAIQNLKHTLGNRLAKGQLGKDEVRAITDIIDRAASEIEKRG